MTVDNNTRFSLKRKVVRISLAEPQVATADNYAYQSQGPVPVPGRTASSYPDDPSIFHPIELLKVKTKRKVKKVIGNTIKRGTRGLGIPDSYVDQIPISMKYAADTVHSVHSGVVNAPHNPVDYVRGGYHAVKDIFGGFHHHKPPPRQTPRLDQGSWGWESDDPIHRIEQPRLIQDHRDWKWVDHSPVDNFKDKVKDVHPSHYFNEGIRVISDVFGRHHHDKHPIQNPSLDPDQLNKVDHSPVDYFKDKVKDVHPSHYFDEGVRTISNVFGWHHHDKHPIHTPIQNPSLDPDGLNKVDHTPVDHFKDKVKDVHPSHYFNDGIRTIRDMFGRYHYDKHPIHTPIQNPSLDPDGLNKGTEDKGHSDGMEDNGHSDTVIQDRKDPVETPHEHDGRNWEWEPPDLPLFDGVMSKAQSTYGDPYSIYGESGSQDFQGSPPEDPSFTESGPQDFQNLPPEDPFATESGPQDFQNLPPEDPFSSEPANRDMLGSSPPGEDFYNPSAYVPTRPNSAAPIYQQKQMKGYNPSAYKPRCPNSAALKRQRTQMRTRSAPVATRSAPVATRSAPVATRSPPVATRSNLPYDDEPWSDPVAPTFTNPDDEPWSHPAASFANPDDEPWSHPAASFANPDDQLYSAPPATDSDPDDQQLYSAPPPDDISPRFFHPIRSLKQKAQQKAQDIIAEEIKKRTRVYGIPDSYIDQIPVSMKYAKDTVYSVKEGIESLPTYPMDYVHGGIEAIKEGVRYAWNPPPAENAFDQWQSGPQDFQNLPPENPFASESGPQDFQNLPPEDPFSSGRRGPAVTRSSPPRGEPYHPEFETSHPTCTRPIDANPYPFSGSRGPAVTRSSAKPPGNLPTTPATITSLRAVDQNAIQEFDIENAMKPNPDAVGLTLEQIKQYGHPAELHNITTEDGYILTYHRIPHGKNNADPSIQRPAILLQHGIVQSSADFVITPNSLGYVLADRGFDVWMGNARGNHYSRKHIKLDADEDKADYWDFSWHEMGYYDLPASIDYILMVTNQKKLFYIGFSMGTTMFFVLGATRPEYMDKIEAAGLMAPVCTPWNIPSPLVNLSKRFTFLFAPNKFGGLHELFALKGISGWMANNFCTLWPVKRFHLCEDILKLVVGYDNHDMDRVPLSVIEKYAPAGTSFKAFDHFVQIIKEDFAHYDHGLFTNLFKYGTKRPPHYDLSRVTAPIYIYHSPRDWLATPEDVEFLVQRLPNVKKVWKVPDRRFNHMDFFYAADNTKKKDLYEEIAFTFSELAGIQM